MPNNRRLVEQIMVYKYPGWLVNINNHGVYL